MLDGSWIKTRDLLSKSLSKEFIKARNRVVWCYKSIWTCLKVRQWYFCFSRCNRWKNIYSYYDTLKHCFWFHLRICNWMANDLCSFSNLTCFRDFRIFLYESNRIKRQSNQKEIPQGRGEIRASSFFNKDCKAIKWLKILKKTIPRVFVRSQQKQLKIWIVFRNGSRFNILCNASFIFAWFLVWF